MNEMVDGGIPFPMLSDAGGKVGRLYGVFNEGAGVEIEGGSLLIPTVWFRATRC